MEKSKNKSWEVRVVHPATEERKWQHNEQVVVIAPTLEEAISKVRSTYPNVTLYSIVHTGEKSVLV